VSAVKTYRRHGCERRHRGYRTLARCMWRRAAWVSGEGAFALVARCGVITVSLWPTLAAAEESKRLIDATACGGRCTRQHEIIKLERPRTEVGA